MRYINFHEWISLWKVKGEIIPKEQSLVRDNICFVFLQLSKRQTTIHFFFKQIFLILSLAWIKLSIDPKNLFKDSNFQRNQDLTPGELNKYNELVQSIENMNDFLLNQILEVLIIGLVANMMIQNWLMDGEIMSLQNDWEYQEEDFQVEIIEQNVPDIQPIHVSDIDLDEKEDLSQNGSRIMNSETRWARNNNELNAIYRNDSLVSR